MPGWPTWRQIVWIVVAMVGARSAAMTMNRIADVRYDRANPRTRGTGARYRGAFDGFCVGVHAGSASLLVVAAWQLNRLALELSPVALAVLFLYSYTKRFTSWSHLVLGFCLGISPAAAWIAVAGSLDARMLILCAAVTLWVGGFDVLYACQDVDFDREAGLFSVPKRFGDRAGAADRARHARGHDRRCWHGSRLVSCCRGRRGRESWWWRRCWLTSIRWCTPTTCAGSMLRFSP